MMGWYLSYDLGKHRHDKTPDIANSMVLRSPFETRCFATEARVAEVAEAWGPDSAIHDDQGQPRHKAEQREQ